MRLDDITPVILTFNEAPNIRRTLAGLTWAKDIVVVDSESTDRTRDILKEFPNVRVFVHRFESHTAQWRYAVEETGIASEWILVLDADFVLPAEMATELEGLAPSSETEGYEARFRFVVQGRPLPRSIFPPRIVLCRRTRARFEQDGHTQRLRVAGEVARLKNTIDHDDRKSLSHWVAAQDKYVQLEREKLRSTPRQELGFADRVRRLRVLAPIAILCYCLFRKGLILQGLPGWHYTYQKVMAEILLSLYLIEERLAIQDGS